MPKMRLWKGIGLSIWLVILGTLTYAWWTHNSSLAMAASSVGLLVNLVSWMARLPPSGAKPNPTADKITAWAFAGIAAVAAPFRVWWLVGLALVGALLFWELWLFHTDK